jgi:two-component system, NtrC family, sensor histidine kinase HydH
VDAKTARAANEQESSTMTPRIVTRLTAPIAAVSVLLLGLAIVAAWYIQDMQERASGPIARSVASMTAAQELEISTREVSVQCNRYLITRDEEYLKKVTPLKRRITAALENAEAASITPAEDELIGQIRKGYDDFYAEYDKLLHNPSPEVLAAILSFAVIPEYDKLLHNPTPQRRYAKIIELTDTVLTNEILDPAHKYLRLNEDMLRQASTTNQQLARRLTNGLLAVGLCGSAGGLLAGWVIAATVRRSLRHTQKRLRDTARQLDAAVPGSESWAEPSTDDVERVSVSVSAVLKRLRQTERDALRAEQLAWVGQMAAGIAHEIRNPLMAIKLLVQTAADRSDGPALRPRDFQVLEEEIIRLEEIVSGFLDFARPPRPDPRPVDMAELASQVAVGLRPRAELQGVAIVIEQPTEPVIVSADPNQLRQVLLNLLFNAIDAQPRGGEVRVAAKIESENSSYPQLLLTVTDNGPGLPPSVGERIFEPFVSTKESGLGLGLSICRRIAEAHGGTLTAANRPTGGAIFTLRFPTHSSVVLREDRELLGCSPKMLRTNNDLGATCQNS